MGFIIKPGLYARLHVNVAACSHRIRAHTSGKEGDEVISDTHKCIEFLIVDGSSVEPLLFHSQREISVQRNLKPCTHWPHPFFLHSATTIVYTQAHPLDQIAVTTRHLAAHKTPAKTFNRVKAPVRSQTSRKCKSVNRISLASTAAQKTGFTGPVAAKIPATPSQGQWLQISSWRATSTPSTPMPLLDDYNVRLLSNATRGEAPTVRMLPIPLTIPTLRYHLVATSSVYGNFSPVLPPLYLKPLRRPFRRTIKVCLVV